jgi:hypothetical protein
MRTIPRGLPSPPPWAAPALGAPKSQNKQTNGLDQERCHQDPRSTSILTEGQLMCFDKDKEKAQVKETMDTNKGTAFL